MTEEATPERGPDGGRDDLRRGPSPVEQSLSVVWSKRAASETEEVSLEQLASRLASAADDGWTLREVTTKRTDVAEVLSVLSGWLRAPRSAENDVYLNGEELEVADGPDGPTLLPNTAFTTALMGHPVRELSYSEASWVSGGPAGFEQSEGIYSIAGIYWAKAVGDMANACTYAGAFDDESEGVAAAAAVSTFHRVTDAGDLECELDEWPNGE